MLMMTAGDFGSGEGVAKSVAGDLKHGEAKCPDVVGASDNEWPVCCQSEVGSGDGEVTKD